MMAIVYNLSHKVKMVYKALVFNSCGPVISVFPCQWVRC